MNIKFYFDSTKNPFRAFRVTFLTTVVLVATTALARADIIFMPMDNGDSGGDLWAELIVEVSGSPKFNPLLSGGWIGETDAWSGFSYPPDFHIGVEENAMDGTFSFEAKSQAGFNATGLSVLKNYLKVSGPGLLSSTPVDPNGDPPEDPPTDHEAWSWAQSSHQFFIEAPEGFWDNDTTYLLHHTFEVNGLLSKTGDTSINLDFNADPGLDISGGSSWDYHFGEAAGDMTEVPFSETFEAQWDPRWDETGVMPGLFGLMHNVTISIYAENSTSGFSAEANFFDTSLTSSITLLTQDGDDDPVSIVTFDSMGNVIEGDTGFSLTTPVPEPATHALLLAVAAFGLVLLRRRKNRA